MNCPQCGTPLSQDRNECTICGWKTAAAAPRVPAGDELPNVAKRTPAAPPPSYELLRPLRVAKPDEPANRTDTWAWIILALLVLGGTIWAVLGSREPSRPGMAGVLVDRFTKDSTLNPGLWMPSGPAGAAAGSKLTLPPSNLVAPSISFSPSNGLVMAGTTAGFQVASIQSTTSVAPPFSVMTDVMSKGSDFDFLLSDDSGQSGVGIAARLNSAGDAAGIKYLTPQIQGQSWATLGTMFPSPEPNTWYTLTISADEAGKWSVEFRDNANVIGSATMPAGSQPLSKGPFYIVLAQSQAATQGDKRGPVCWRAIQETSDCFPRATERSQ
jgi:hypothetical protein